MFSNIGETVAQLSETYSVNPVIFGVLYVGGIPLFLGVLGWLANRARQKKSVTVQAMLLLYLAVQPYLYVAIFGENLPSWVYIVIVALIGYGIYSTVKTVRKRKAEAEAVEAGPSSSISMDPMSASDNPK
ncbi:MAG: hypothetical protein AAF788_01835 [Pseudomonadota bacterium]